jgi:sialate O-acetylesterase
MKKILFILSIFIFGCKSDTSSKFSLNNLFSDHMVLQQDTLVNFWGVAPKGTEISLNTSWGEKAIISADNSGNWLTQIKTPKFDEKSHKITLSTDDETIEINDVLMGEVWLASGQSNMEMPMKGFKYAKVHELIEGAEEEISKADIPQIRMFTVKRNISYIPQKNVEGDWVVCSPESISEFSAVAYFFGKKLNQELGVPIGLIHSSWGGSPAESWVRKDYIEKIKGYENTSKRLEIAIDPKSEYNLWVANHSHVKRDSLIGVNDFKWVNNENKQFVKNNFNDDSWIKKSTRGVSEAFEKNNFNGIGWIRQQINISQITKSDLVFDIGKTNDLYTVFINGKMIGRKEYWGVASTKYLIKNDLLKRGNNTISIRFIDVYGQGGLDPDPNRGIYLDNKKNYFLK